MRRWMLWVVVAVLAVGVAAPAFSGLVAPSGDEALVMVSLTPCAIFDTRTASAGKMTSGETRSFGVVGSGDFSGQGGSASGCGVPGYDAGVPQAQAVLVNLVAIEAAGGGNLKAWAGDGAEATGGVVNYQALSPAMANSNAIVVELNQTTQGQDVKVKVNGAGVHVRGVVLGYFVSGDHTFLTYEGYDSDRDGSVAAADSADLLDGLDSADLWQRTDQVDAATVDGLEGSELLERYCANQARYPQSYPAGPCRDVLTTVDSTGNVGGHASLAIGVDGNPIISYHDNTNGDLKVVHCTTADCSSWDVPQAVDQGGDVGRWSSLAIGINGDPIISYHDNTNGYLKVVACTNPACSSWKTPPQQVDTTFNVGRYTSLAIGVDGNPIISYYDSFNVDLKVVHCTHRGCATWDTPQTVDSIGSVGQYTSLAIGVDGNPIISYWDASSGNADLRVVHCTTRTCSRWDTPQTVDSAGDVGRHTSLAIGIAGNPVISYYDSSFTNLKVVSCTTPACNSWDTPQTIDNAGDVGRYTSLAIGVDGNPVISYYDFTNGDLKVARLGR